MVQVALVQCPKREPHKEKKKKKIIRILERIIKNKYIYLKNQQNEGKKSVSN